MKCYFDNPDEHQSNLSHLKSFNGSNYWQVPNGTNIKKNLRSAGATISMLEHLDEAGCYVIDVNGDPEWWCGLCLEDNTPSHHVLSFLPEDIIALAKNKQLRIVITADREGGPMVSDRYDCFKATTDIIIKLGLPAKSVLILQGNRKIEQQYSEWLLDTHNEQLFECMFSTHFDRIFFDNNLPLEPVVCDTIANPLACDFSSLNRVYRSHRGAHLYYLSENKVLDKGLVSGNQINLRDGRAIRLVKTSLETYSDVMSRNFPKFIDGDWSTTNAANQYNLDIYRNSLISFITETMFDKDVVFLTEKIFKPLVLGHPLILLSSPGTLRGLEELGFRINWCGIDPSYNDIKDDYTRFIKTHQVLFDWINLPRDEKIGKILDSMDTINYNFSLVRSRNYYQESLQLMLTKTEDYFKNA
jgi:hypothetical protein